jgi:hypothetical protein
VHARRVTRKRYNVPFFVTRFDNLARNPMFGRFMPTEGKFFELFNRTHIVSGGRELER